MKHLSAQFTSDEAVAFHDSGEWKNWSDAQIAHFQMRQQFLAIPFERFHAAVQKTLGRPVWTHEFADREALIAELDGKIPAPDFAGILAKLPAERTVVVVTPQPEPQR